MAGSYTTMATQMNTMFNSANKGNTGQRFRLKHGNNGHGGGAGQERYRFGAFAKDSLTDDKHPKWLIDTGTRHWDPASIKKLEDAVIDSLTQSPGNEYTMNFTLGSNSPGPQATADVTKTTKNGRPHYDVIIHCPP